MLKRLKKHFIPHHTNNHRPHILRNLGIQRLIILIIFIQLVLFLTPIPGQMYPRALAAVLPAVMADLTNNERMSEGLATLIVNPVLNDAAQAKATDMATKSYFAHTSPEGRTPWYWLDLVGYQYEYAGENLAVSFTDSGDVVRAWMESPTHRENIMKRSYTEVGTGVATGIFEGKETIFVAQVYGNPLPSSNIQNPPVQPSVLVEEIATPAPEHIQGKVVEEENEEVLGVEAETTPTETPSPEETQVEATQAESAPVAVIETESSPTQVEVTEEVAGSESTQVPYAEVAPRNTMNIFLIALFSLVASSLVLYAFIRTRNHRFDTQN